MTGVPAYNKVKLLHQFFSFSCSICLMVNVLASLRRMCLLYAGSTFFCSICLMQEECSDEMQKKWEGSWELEKAGVAV